MSPSFPNSLREQAVWVDTGFVYAVQWEGDGFHTLAASWWKQMVTEHVPLILCAPVLYETQRLLRYRAGFDISQRFLRLYPDIFNLYIPDKEEIRQATELLGRWPDQSITLTDALVGRAASKDGARVATFDFPHFSVFGVRFFS